MSSHNESNQAILQVKLTLDQTVEWHWKVDHETAAQLQAVITDTAPAARYRMSMHSSWNSSLQQHYSTVTKYGPDGSEKLSFIVSDAYAEQLAALRTITDIKQLKELSFYSDTSVSKPEPSSNMHSNRKKEKPIRTWSKSRIALASLLIVAGCLIHFPKYSYFTEQVRANVTTASPEYVETSIVELAAAQAKEPVMPAVSDLKQLPASEVHTSDKNTKQLYPSIQLQEGINFSVPKGHVALTFDDGPSLYTKDIADVLKKYGVGGTFFFVGSQISKYPEAVKYVHDEGFVIGNHSMTHSSFPQLPQMKQKQEISQTNALIEEITASPVQLFRPPYGATHPEMQSILDQYNMKIVLWNRDPEDWNTNDPEQILKYITNANASGSIILLHETQATLDVLPAIIEYLQKQQLQISNIY